MHHVCVELGVAAVDGCLKQSCDDWTLGDSLTCVNNLQQLNICDTIWELKSEGTAICASGLDPDLVQPSPDCTFLPRRCTDHAFEGGYSAFASDFWHLKIKHVPSKTGLCFMEMCVKIKILARNANKSGTFMRPKADCTKNEQSSSLWLLQSFCIFFFFF